ncbi:hypothetical protein EC988_006136 [Linderina pennispora]|nr:hypothetical protein EC988_006136 [Linderina pennispora]
MLEILDSPEALACDAILLSGGLDTSIASEAMLAQAKHRAQLAHGLTLTIDPQQNPDLFPRAPEDIKYAQKIASKLGLTHHKLTPSLEDLLTGDTMRLCVRVLRTFDGMGLRNSVVIAYALQVAKQIGCRRICTGDGADELFAGYSFMHKMEDSDLRKYTENMLRTMQFCAFPLAKELGIQVWSPYLDQRLIDYAVSENGGQRANKIGEFQGHVHGKLVLRQAFPEVVSAARVKEPIEVGCGTAVMPGFIAQRISDGQFAEEAREALEKYDIVVRDKERLAYFRTFRTEVLDRPEVLGQMGRYGQDACPDCKFRLRDGTSFCSVCGLYPARPITKD